MKPVIVSSDRPSLLVSHDDFRSTRLSSCYAFHSSRPGGMSPLSVQAELLEFAQGQVILAGRT
jgi:hypothetical protein